MIPQLGPYTVNSRRLGVSGSFGQIYRGTHWRTGTDVVIKLERSDAATALLKHECNILSYLSDRCCENVPKVEWWSTLCLDGVKYRALVLPMLDMTLAEAAASSIATAEDHVHWVQEMIRILYQVHEAGILHRDIKPQNFMLRFRPNTDGSSSSSSSSSSIVYLIDFGLSSVYIGGEFNGHLPPKPDQEYILGTPKYVSLHVHEGKDASRRDDLISVGYVWLFLLLGGRLPWDHVAVPTAETTATPLPPHHIHYPANQERRRLKLECLQHLLQQQPQPQQQPQQQQELQLGQYFDQVYRLSYDDRPRYADLIDLLAMTL